MDIFMHFGMQVKLKVHTYLYNSLGILVNHDRTAGALLELSMGMKGGEIRIQVVCFT